MTEHRTPPLRPLRAVCLCVGMAVVTHAAVGAADEAAQTGLRSIGSYPDARVELTIVLKASDQFSEVEVTLRDREQNQILRKAERYAPGKGARTVRMDVTPPPRAVGPFVLEYQVANERGDISLRHEQRFAHANAVIPLTSMQSDRMIDWFRSTYPSPDDWTGYYKKMPFNSTDIVEPALFDGEVFHSGGRSLRIPYRAGRATHLYSNLQLPGFPIRAHVWVRGNGSGDRLLATFRDRCELTRNPWERLMNRNKAAVCTLDFEGWRRFPVPVVGEGLQVESRHESSVAAGGSDRNRPVELAVPVHLLAFSVEAGKAKEGEPPERAIWIDDLAIETQVPLNERVSIELRGDTPDAQLHADGKIVMAIGNGTGAPFEEGRVQVSVRDRRGDAVFETSRAVEAGAGAFAFVEIPMARIAEARPDGPVTVDATFTAPSAGLRIRGSLVLKASKYAAVVWDFEDRQRYSGLDGTAGAETAAGGAEGSRNALLVPAPTNAVNHVILHPALPGIPTRVEMMVKGGSAPVGLRPQFFDAGRIGAQDMLYNKFQTPEIVVEGQEWRRVSFVAPAIPVGYDDPDKQFIFEATYPLNLVLSAQPTGDVPSEIYVDRIMVHTHLDDADAVVTAPVYPDDKEIMKPDDPLLLRIQNYHGVDRNQTFDVRLADIHGRPVVEESRTLELAPGQTVDHVLMSRLPRGVYNLEVSGDGVRPVRERIIAVPIGEYFGETPETLLRDLPAIERQIGMATRRIYLDWDNLELMPGMFHFNWFHNEIAKASAEGKYRVAAILGFSADWAGPGKWEEVQEKAYGRFIGNHMQVPVRLTDWSRYVREAVRAFAGKVVAWEFWENPDYRGSPVYIKPERYRPMLEIVRRWVDMYDPETPVVAGGFSADNVYNYLRTIPEPETLPFDRLGIQFNIGELSPEGADMEGLLDDLNSLLKLNETERGIDVPQLDWAVGELVSPLQQAAYHARAILIMNRRLRETYRLTLANDGETFDGYGLFYRRPYGNTPNLQGLRPLYLPKPAYFAIATTHRALEKCRFDTALRIPDRDAAANYAYLYEKEGGIWMAALWRARGEARDYRVPADWKGATAMDAFGTAAPLRETISFGRVPLFVTFPAGCSIGQIRHELRVLQPADGHDRRLLVLMTADPDSARRAEYRATGTHATLVRRDRRLIGGEPVEHAFLTGLSEEHFTFTADKPGKVRLARTWLCDEGQTNFVLSVMLNDGPEQPWDLSLSETGKGLEQHGIRESSLLLQAVTPGVNRVAIRHKQPGSTACWTVAPVPDKTVDLAYWDPINAVQSKGFPLTSLSARGTPLRIGDQTFKTGIGTLSPAYIEYPLQEQFARLEVTVGIDAAGRGRGNAVFSIYGDGRLLAGSGSMSGFSPPKTLVVEDLGTVSRLALRVVNAEEDGSEGLANWVDAKLYRKTIED